MILSEKRKFLMLSVNKTATSSMEEALKDQHIDKELRLRALITPSIEKEVQLKIFRKGWNTLPRFKHLPAIWVKENLAYIAPGLEWDQLFKFCFVRHPYNRLLSIYRFHTQKLQQTCPEAVRCGSFSTWLQMGGAGAARKAIQHQL